MEARAVQYPNRIRRGASRCIRAVTLGESHGIAADAVAVVEADIDVGPGMNAPIKTGNRRLLHLRAEVSCAAGEHVAQHRTGGG